MKTLARYLLPALALAALASLPTTAATLYVATTGDDMTADGTLGLPYLTIQAAYDDALDNDTIRVMPGTYIECIFASVITQRSINLEAEDWFVNQDNTTTIIDGTAQCFFPFSVVNIGGFNSRVEGFTITGGGAGGIFTIGTVTITNNMITGNTSTAGAGIYANPATCYYGDTLTQIIDNTVVNNSVAVQAGEELSGRGGGIFVRAQSEPFISGSLGCVGGAPTVIIDNNTVTDNTATLDGGGIYAFTNTTTDLATAVTVTGNLISGNTAGLGATDGAGGGIFVTTFGYYGENFTVSNNNVAGNFGTEGAGISARIDSLDSADHNVAVNDNNITGNSAEADGGGLDLFLYAQDLMAVANVDIEAIGNTVSGNDAAGSNAGGGGVLATFQSIRSNAPSMRLAIGDNRIIGNTANVIGGGASLFASAEADDESLPVADGIVRPATATIDFIGNLVAGNTATQPGFVGAGGGLFNFFVAFGEATATIRQDFNTISDNVADTVTSGGVEIELLTGFDNAGGPEEGLAVLEMNNNIIDGNTGFGVGGPAPGGAMGSTANIDNSGFTYNNVFGSGNANYEGWFNDRTNLQGNISLDSLLDPITQVPMACSPTIDAADPAIGVGSEPAPNGALANLGHTGTTANAATSLADPNGDNIVDGIDVLQVSVSFGSSLGGVRFIPTADQDGNDTIDGTDLAFVAAQFGDTCPN
ncbi:MAG: hypothetical protein OES25_12885 [Acidobacteriota bacterium]|nr:hypothetical protein [Acidobacteriota bacterium]